MKKFLTYLFIFFGFLFVLEVGGLAYLWFADPFNIRPLISTFTSRPGDSASLPSDTKSVGTRATEDKNPALSPAQEAALETVGIDPAKLPTSITPTMQSCFVEKLGSTRVKEIQNGSTPTPTEVFTTRSCYQ